MIFCHKVDTLNEMTKQNFDKNLLCAYKKTRYHVSDLALDIKVGQIPPIPDHLFANSGLHTWAFVTAWNPWSRPLDSTQNQQRHLSLTKACESFTTFDAWGIPSDDNWEPEQSLLIVGISKQQALELGKRFGQHAIVFGDKGQPATLLFCSER